MKASANILVVTKKAVAQSQLETAITLWFTGGDPVSIHTLAVAAQDCYRALAAHSKIESPFKVWAESQSKNFQKKLLDTQNFFKHGQRELKGKVHLAPLHSDMLMYDAALTHERLFGRGRDTVLMFLYCVRFCVENPHLGATVLAPGSEWLKAKVPVNVSRRQLFEMFLEREPFLTPPQRKRAAS